jgi:predicted transport protein
MSDIKLFRLHAGQATELQGDVSDLEKPLQNLIEANLDTLLGIRFLASEYSTGKTHGGRIDTLGLDENHCPVILEYKRSKVENVINQGLFYLDWLMDHQAEFKLLVLEKFGKVTADAIDWSAPRLVCIAADFTKYDGHAVQQINRNIELIRYRRFGSELLLFELANASSAAKPKASAKASKAVEAPAEAAVAAKPGGPDKSYADVLPTLAPETLELLASLEDHVTALGDDVQRKELRLYLAFKRIKNFATVVLHKKGKVLLYLHVDPSMAAHLPMARNVTDIGHWGTGNLELTLSTLADLEAAKPYLAAAYEGLAAKA